MILIKLNPHPLHYCNYTAELFRFIQIMWGGDLTKGASFNVKHSWMLPQVSDGQTVLLPVNHFTTGIHLSLSVLTD